MTSSPNSKKSFALSRVTRFLKTKLGSPGEKEHRSIVENLHILLTRCKSRRLTTPAAQASFESLGSTLAEIYAKVAGVEEKIVDLERLHRRLGTRESSGAKSFHAAPCQACHELKNHLKEYADGEGRVSSKEQILAKLAEFASHKEGSFTAFDNGSQQSDRLSGFRRARQKHRTRSDSHRLSRQLIRGFSGDDALVSRNKSLSQKHATLDADSSEPLFQGACHVAAKTDVNPEQSGIPVVAVNQSTPEVEDEWPQSGGIRLPCQNINKFVSTSQLPNRAPGAKPITQIEPESNCFLMNPSLLQGASIKSSSIDPSLPCGVNLPIILKIPAIKQAQAPPKSVPQKNYQLELIARTNSSSSFPSAPGERNPESEMMNPKAPLTTVAISDKKSAGSKRNNPSSVDQYQHRPNHGSKTSSIQLAWK